LSRLAGGTRAVPEDYFTFMAVSGPATGSRWPIR